ncbi:hypothetical protein Tco_1418318 [Tanacetum coccineum]
METQLVVVVKLHEIDKHFVELMVVGELLEADTIGNEKVLYRIVNVVERDNTVEQLVITVVDMVRNAIALFKLAIGSSPGRNDGTIDKHFVELMVVGELLEADTIGNEKVLYRIVNVVERDNTVEQLVITVVDSE